MSGWTALCFFLVASHVGEPMIGLIAIIVYAINDSPRQRCEKLEARIKELERNG